MELPESGAPETHTLALGDVTEGNRRMKFRAQGELVLRVAWVKPTAEELEAAAGVDVDESAELGEYVDEDDPNGGGGGGGGDDDDEAAAAERAKAEEAEETLVANPPKRGDYQLQVHVLEARDLVGRDLNGASDPAVFVSAFGETKRTTSKDVDTNPIWDEQLFFSAKDIDEDGLNSTQIELKVYDMDTFNKNDLIGQFAIDTLQVYYRPGHELWKKWVALSAPYSARRNLIGEDERGGIQGYLKVSCVLLGPGDKPEIHEPDEEEDNSNDSAVLMPPALKRELMFLRVGVVKAKKL